MSVFVSVCIILGVCYSYVPYNICPTYLEYVIKINIFAVRILVFWNWTSEKWILTRNWETIWDCLWLTYLFNVMWMSGTVSVERHTGLVIPIFKRVCGKLWAYHTALKISIPWCWKGRNWDSGETMLDWLWSSLQHFHPIRTSESFMGTWPWNLHVFCGLGEGPKWAPLGIPGTPSPLIPSVLVQS